MKSRSMQAFAAAALLCGAMVCGAVAGGALLSGCASDQPYTAPQVSPQRTLPRAPVVAPSGPTSPFFWPLPDTWWPFNW